MISFNFYSSQQENKDNLKVSCKRRISAILQNLSCRSELNRWRNYNRKKGSLERDSMMTFCLSFYQCNLFQWKQCATSIPSKQWSNVSRRQESYRNQGAIQKESHQEDLSWCCCWVGIYWEILKESDFDFKILKFFLQRDLWEIQETQRSTLWATS